MAEPRRIASPDDLWTELKRRRGAKTTRELARKLGIEAGDPERNFYRWVSAKRGSHEATVHALDWLGYVKLNGYVQDVTQEAKALGAAGGVKFTCADT